MSAFVSIVHPYGAHVFSDGAVWSPDQRLVDIRYKMTVAKSGRLAVTTIGDAETGTAIARDICDRADFIGATAMIDGLQTYADDVAQQLGVIDSQRSFEILVAAYIPGRGGQHRAFRSYAVGHHCAYEVIDPGSNTHWSGAKFTTQDIKKFGLVQQPGEPDPDFVRRFGIGVLEVMRVRQGQSQKGGPRDIWCVGGHIDCTSLLHSGAKHERIVDWPDVIGEKIDPYRGMSRGERRRAMRMAA